MPVLVFGKVRDLIARNRPVASGRFGSISVTENLEQKTIRNQLTGKSKAVPSRRCVGADPET